MRELFKEYGLFCLDILAATIGIKIFFSLFWGSEAMLNQAVMAFVETLL